ncbi:hypothetical protein BDZ91DRAFT_802180 [Kalaharituber pfeilii]|nr:hypothetical protein BDZ91DRAFT_802180 [Kalaharituber pfeilii]
MFAVVIPDDLGNKDPRKMLSPDKGPFTSVERKSRQRNMSWNRWEGWKTRWPGGREAIRKPPTGKKDEPDPLAEVMRWVQR